MSSIASSIITPVISVIASVAIVILIIYVIYGQTKCKVGKGPKAGSRKCISGGKKGKGGTQPPPPPQIGPVQDIGCASGRHVYSATYNFPNPQSFNQTELVANIAGVNRIADLADPTSRGVGTAYWYLDDPACLTVPAGFQDRGEICSQGRRVWRATFIGAFGQSDAERIAVCQNTPHTIKGVVYPRPTFCDRSAPGVYAEWDIPSDIPCP